MVIGDIKIEEAEKFLTALDPSTDQFTFQVFDDVSKEHGKKDFSKAKTLYGSLAQLKETLEEYNRKGCGIYVTINSVTPNQRRTAENVDAIRAFFIDRDEGPITVVPPIPPSIIVQGSRGPHLYYVLSEHVTDSDHMRDAFRDMQERLINFFDGDVTIKDLPRVMRLPGFWHMKNPKKPFMVTVDHVSDHTYSYLELIETFPQVEKKNILEPVSRPPVDYSGEDRGVLSWRAAAFLEKPWDATEGNNNELAHAIANIKKNNYTREECVELLERKGESLDENTKGQIRAIYRDDDNYEVRPYVEVKKKESGMAQQSSGDGSNKGWGYFLNTSTFYQDLLDKDNFVTVNIEFKKIKRFDKQVVYNALGRKHVEKSTILSEFSYNPLNNTINYTDKNGCSFFNCYSPPFWKEDNYFEGSEVPFEETIPAEYDHFFKHLFAEDEESIEYVLDWMANAIQGNRNIPILALVGSVRGIGKNIFSYINKALHGESNFETVSQRIVTKEFNGQMGSRTMVQFDEVSIKTEDQYEAIKVYTNPYISVESKGRDAKTLELHANIIMTNNVSDCLNGVSAKDDRQFSIPMLTGTPINQVEPYKSNNKLFGKLYTDLDLVKRLAYYLYHREVNYDRLSTNLKTEHYYDTIKSSTYEWHHVLLEDIYSDYQGEIIAINTLKTALKYYSGANIGREKIESLSRDKKDIFRIVRIGSKRYLAFSKFNESEEDFTNRLSEYKKDKWKTINFIEEISISNKPKKGAE